MNAFKHIPFSLKTSKKNLAFTLVELLIAMTIFATLSTAIFRVMKSQSLSLSSQASDSKNQTQTTAAYQRFASDLSRIDPNWQKLGIPTVFPLPGYAEGFGDANAYSGLLAQMPNGIKHDGVTLLLKVPSQLHTQLIKV